MAILGLGVCGPQKQTNFLWLYIWDMALPTCLELVLPFGSEKWSVWLMDYTNRLKSSFWTFGDFCDVLLFHLFDRYQKQQV